MQKQVVQLKHVQFPSGENHYVSLFRDRFARSGIKRRVGGELEAHSIRVAKATHDRVRDIPLAVEGLFHAFELKEVLEKCPELTGLINPYQFRAYKLLKEWEMHADLDSPASMHKFLNILYRFPLAVVLRVLDLEDISHNEPKERIKIYRSIGEGDPENAIRKTTDAIDAIYIPVARRLGWDDVRWRLRDVSLSVHYPNLREQIFGWYELQESKLEGLKTELEHILPYSPLAERSIRMKTRESLFRKLVKKCGETDEATMMGKCTSKEQIAEMVPDMVAGSYVLHKNSSIGDLMYLVKNQVIPRLKESGFEIVLVEGNEFEIKKLGGNETNLIHVLAKAPKKFGAYPIEIQVLTRQTYEEMSNGDFAHEIYKGGKLDPRTMKKIEGIGSAIRTHAPEEDIQRNLVQIKHVDCNGQDMGWETVGLSSNITILDLLAAIGAPSKEELHLETIRSQEAQNIFVNPTKLGMLMNTVNTAIQINGYGSTIHETEGRKEGKFIAGVLNELWATTLAGFVHKMMVLDK